jgi:predicted CoA-binding protein
MTDTEEAIIARMLAGRRIAVVGLSDDPSRPSYGVSSHMLNAGYQIVPVNPNADSALGQKCVPKLTDVAGPVDVVNVFRRPLACPQVVRDAIAIGAKGVWLQSGIVNDEARQIAADAGIDFVQDRCIMVEHMRRQPN